MGLAGPAQAQDANTIPALKNYAIPRGGALWPVDNELNHGAKQAATLDYNVGYGVSPAYGYRFFPRLRAEIEGGYLRAGTDKMNLTGRGSQVSDDGYEQHLYIMLNGLVDWQNQSDFTPFAGLGLWYSQVTRENERINRVASQSYPDPAVMGPLPSRCWPEWLGTVAPIGTWNCGAVTLALLTGSMRITPQPM